VRRRTARCACVEPARVWVRAYRKA
jgi:hypothetical protein